MNDKPRKADDYNCQKVKKFYLVLLLEVNLQRRLGSRDDTILMSAPGTCMHLHRCRAARAPVLPNCLSIKHERLSQWRELLLKCVKDSLQTWYKPNWTFACVILCSPLSNPGWINNFTALRWDLILFTVIGFVYITWIKLFIQTKLAKEYQWKCHEEAIEACRRKSLDQFVYFLSRDLAFLRDVYKRQTSEYLLLFHLTLFMLQCF
jgi:hypothetical protein